MCNFFILQNPPYNCSHITSTLLRIIHTYDPDITYFLYRCNICVYTFTDSNDTNNNGGKK